MTEDCVLLLKLNDAEVLVLFSEDLLLHVYAELLLLSGILSDEIVSWTDVVVVSVVHSDGRLLFGIAIEAFDWLWQADVLECKNVVL